ncbi:O-antigen ligase family protein, partial [bacterium]|nr:O-antigen ligase family protein [bacterium]
FIYLMDPVYIKRLMTLGQAKDTSISETKGGTRILFWAAGLDMVKDHPLGTGGGGFQDLSPYYLPEELLGTSRGKTARSSHNTYILVMVEQGPVGLAIFIGFIGSTFLLLHRARRKILNKYLSDKIANVTKAHEHLFGQIVALESSIAGLLVGSIFVDRLYFEPLYWLCALASVLYYLTESRDELEEV